MVVMVVVMVVMVVAMVVLVVVMVVMVVVICKHAFTPTHQPYCHQVLICWNTIPDVSCQAVTTQPVLPWQHACRLDRAYHAESCIL